MDLHYRCSLPNNNLQEFDSALHLSPGRPDKTLPQLTAGAGTSVDLYSELTYSLSMNQFLPHGCVVRGTKGNVIGMAVYTGAETKLSLSQQSPPNKWTQADEVVNQISISIFCAQLLIVAVFGSVGSWWKYNESDHAWYLDYESNEPWYTPLVIPIRFLLLNSYMIPISLKVISHSTCSRLK